MTRLKYLPLLFLFACKTDVVPYCEQLETAKQICLESGGDWQQGIYDDDTWVLWCDGGNLVE